MNIARKAEEESRLRELKEKCNWDLISFISRSELNTVDFILKQLALNLEKKGIVVGELKSRTKSFESALAKCEGKNIEPTFDNMINSLYDLAAGRIIVNSLPDVEAAKSLLGEMGIQKDTPFSIIETRDYINNPKENGYRSFHVIIRLMVTNDNVIYPMQSEIQIRTSLQDEWSDMEHKIGYKNNNQSSESKVLLRKISDFIKEYEEKEAKRIMEERAEAERLSK